MRATVRTTRSPPARSRLRWSAKASPSFPFGRNTSGPTRLCRVSLNPMTAVSSVWVRPHPPDSSFRPGSEGWIQWGGSGL
eukprot:5225522-Alexandrium_andersonii.AAC.1